MMEPEPTERADPAARESTAPRLEHAVERNEALFREANEHIRRVAEKYGAHGLVPFICECLEVSCTAIVRMTLAEYGSVRADPLRSLMVPGHEVVAKRGTRLVSSCEQYVVVERSAPPERRRRAL